MARKYAIQYIDRLLDGDTYRDLVELSSAIRSSPDFTLSVPDYGLPTFAFLFAETLLWFAQATRSGVWTYYEATPSSRQLLMAKALRHRAPEGFARWYEVGMKNWRDKREIRAVDQWMEGNDEVANAWLRELARENREVLLEMT